MKALTSTNKLVEEDQKVEIIFFTAVVVARRLSPTRSTLSLGVVVCPPSDRDLSWPLPGESEVGEQPLTSPSQESEAAIDIITYFRITSLKNNNKTILYIVHAIIVIILKGKASC